MSGVIFGYQMVRALSQYIQVLRCDGVVNYVLNGISLLGYTGFVLYMEFGDGGILWCIPLLFTSLSETMAYQQLCMLQYFDGVGISRDDMTVRVAVKASWTAAGVAAVLSFIAASQLYEAFGLRGVAYAGLASMALKVAVIVQIDYLHFRKMKAIEGKN